MLFQDDRSRSNRVLSSIESVMYEQTEDEMLNQYSNQLLRSGLQNTADYKELSVTDSQERDFIVHHIT
ncbi:MAG: hypothetical protein QMB24_08220 [Spirosomataceae bacterium]